MIVLKTVDAHVGGSPLRLLTEGFPSPPGRTMADKLRWAERHASQLQRILMREPRGHSDMCGAVLTEPCTSDAHAGVLFMDADRFHALSGHGAVAVAAIATERRLVTRAEQDTPLVLDTATGPVRAVTRAAGGQTTVELTGGPAFVLHAGLDVVLTSRSMRVDIAFGGAFYALVDSESAGVPLLGTHEADLRRVASALSDRIGGSLSLAHPLLPHATGLRGVIFTGPAQLPGADLRIVSVAAGGRVSRGPSGTGLAAVMAVLSAMGLSPDEPGIVAEGLIGTSLRGRVVNHVMVGDHEAVVPMIAGTTWITGDHTFSVESADPLAGGFRTY